MDIEPTSPAAQLALLRQEAARKRATIREHHPKTGPYYTMRDQQTGHLIGRYDTLLDLDDALINWVDAPNADLDLDR